MVVEMVEGLIEIVTDWWDNRKAKQKEETAMSKYGWDCNCPACKKLMHTNELVEKFEATDDHWHYTCKCGFKSAWALHGPVPMYDPSYTEPTINAPDNY